jgi:hypothetical protein
MLHILGDSDLSDSSNESNDEGRPPRDYKQKVNFAFVGEEFRQRYRLSATAAEWLLGRIGHRLEPLRGVDVRTADLSPKERMIITLK